jgi:hypothetical protein
VKKPNFTFRGLHGPAIPRVRRDPAPYFRIGNTPVRGLSPIEIERFRRGVFACNPYQGYEALQVKPTGPILQETEHPYPFLGAPTVLLFNSSPKKPR